MPQMGRFCVHQDQYAQRLEREFNADMEKIGDSSDSSEDDGANSGQGGGGIQFVAGVWGGSSGNGSRGDVPKMVRISNGGAIARGSNGGRGLTRTPSVVYRQLLEK